MSLYLLFLDYGESYDQVNRENWCIIDQYKINSNIINVIKSFYANHKVHIKTRQFNTGRKWYPSKYRPQTKCDLFPLSIVLYLTMVIQKWLIQNSKVNKITKQYSIKTILFADDQQSREMIF